MKYSLLLSAALSLCISSTAIAKDYLLALSPHQYTKDAKDQIKTLVPFLTELEEGDKVTIIDGHNIKTIGEFIIPPGKTYHSPKARIAKNRTTMAALIQFARSSRGQEDYIHIPNIMRHAALVAADKPALEVIIIGSPLHNNFADFKFSMYLGRFPSDGHIRASRKASPYGTKGYESALKNVRVHFGIKQEQNLVDDRRKYIVERFWTLYIEAMGGKLVSFTSDLPTLLSRAKSGVTAPDHGFILEETDKLEMINTYGSSIGYIFSQPPSSDLSVDLTKSYDVKLGLSWRCTACDFDLYATLGNVAETPVSYKNTSTSFGNHWKLTDARNGAHFAEAISFKDDVTLKDITIAVNLYSGFVSDAEEAELRLSVDGKVYARSLIFSNLSGNNGAGVDTAIRNGQSRTSKTIIIRPADFFKG